MLRSITLKKYLNLSLAGGALFASLGVAAAQQGQGQGQASKQAGQVPGQTIITDATGATHVYQARIGDNARKEVAQRQKAAKAKNNGGK
jgi:hypothetical protein